MNNIEQKSCPYMTYKPTEKYFPRLYCTVKDRQCFFAKRCDIEERFIPNGDLWKECGEMIKAMQTKIPQGSYFVQTYRPNKKGKLYLYVVINGKTEKILTNLESINQDYIYLKDGIDGYEVGLVPFKEEPKIETITIKSIEDVPSKKPSKRVVKNKNE